MYDRLKHVILLPNNLHTAGRFEIAARKYELKPERRPYSEASIVESDAGSSIVVQMRNRNDKKALALVRKSVEIGARVGVVSLTDVEEVRGMIRIYGAQHCSADELNYTRVMRWLSDERSIKRWLKSKQDSSI